MHRLPQHRFRLLSIELQIVQMKTTPEYVDVIRRSTNAEELENVMENVKVGALISSYTSLMLVLFQ